LRRGGTGLQIKVVFFVVIFSGIQGLALLAGALYELPLAGMVWTAIGITALSSFVSAVWGASLTRSVLELMRACRVAIKGDLHTQTILPRGDEIGELCDEINSLVEALRTYRDEVIRLRGQPGAGYAESMPGTDYAAAGRDHLGTGQKHDYRRPEDDYGYEGRTPLSRDEGSGEHYHPHGPDERRFASENEMGKDRDSSGRESGEQSSHNHDGRRSAQLEELREKQQKLSALAKHLRDLTESVAGVAEAFSEAKEAAWAQLQLCEKASVRLEVIESGESDSSLKGIAEEARDETARLRELLKTASEKLKSVPELSEIRTLFREVDVLALNATIELTKGANREKAVGIIDDLREKLGRLSKLSSSILIEPPEELDSAAESGETLNLELGRILEITNAMESATSESREAHAGLRRIVSSMAEIASILQESVNKSQVSMDKLRSAQETLGIALKRIELEDEPLA
jgi:hypothetical protein